MKKIVSMLMSMSVLFGCASHQDFESRSGSSQEITSIPQIDWHEVMVPSSFSMHFSKQSQLLENSDISSPVAGFSFEVTEPRVTIEISGIVRELKVFAPNLALYDQDFNLLRKYTSEHFDYDRDDFVKGNVLFGDVELNLPLNITRVYGVIYTTDNDLSNTTELIHPAKAFAIAKRNDPPAIDDPIAKHVNVGEVSVVIKRDSIFTGLLEKPTKSASAPEIPQEYSEPGIIADSVISDVQPETKTFYYQAIETAVAENNIPKALGLLDEAKALGIEGVQEVFVKAINKK
ncbi:maltose-binding protein [Vibrio sp. SM6]|uniref:Maltose-binding protein n=1 Tax=Vibrio agarilyticus TaxID=2726741 RepID=A0A7X8TSY2_9VIBR|nr:MalM family protein [Vibrio agarilyticus]NLS14300.1 maltose-binding protein [Vibrio agarilyticus]